MTKPGTYIKSMLVVLICCFAINNYAQISDARFKRITIDDGLSMSSIYCIYQDSRGFMWFGTEDGLNKYDGKNFTIYNHKPGEENSLTNKWVEKITEDRYGNIWIGSSHGLTLLDPTTNRMHQYLSKKKDGYSLSNDTITCYTADDNYLWVGTKKGVSRIDLKSKESKIIRFSCIEDSPEINTIVNDKRGQVWIGSVNGLGLYNPNKENIQCHLSNINDSPSLNIKSILADKDIIYVGTDQSLIKIVKDYQPIITPCSEPVDRLMLDSKNRIWVQTNEGLFIYENKILHKIVEGGNPSPSLAINPKIPLIEDNEGDIWFGTFGHGAYEIKENGDILNYRYDPTNNASISEDNITCINADNNNGIWLGTFGAGLSIYDPNTNLIKTLKHNALNPNSMSSSFVWSICEAADKKLWIGTHNTGISIFNPSTGTFEHIQNELGNSISLPPFAVREIYTDLKGDIWIGSDGGGLGRYNKSSNDFTFFTHDPDDSESISDNSVRVIYQDSTEIYWIGTRNGLNRFNPKTGKFKRYIHDQNNPKSLSNNFIYSSIYRDSKGYLWTGTYGGGLNKMNIEEGSFEHFRHDVDNPSSISSDIVFSIHEDEKGYFWIGTNSGLNLLNPGSGKFKRYGMESGLPNEVIYGIMPDNNNGLWLTTNKGISKLDLTEFRFKNFDVSDGLQSNEFNGGAFYRGSNGLLYAGGVYGLNIIEPALIKPSPNNASLLISRLEILGKDVKVMHQNMFADSTESPDHLIESVDNYYLPVHVSYLNDIKLSYKQRFFSIEFTALNHLDPEKLTFRYRMKNLEDHWNYAGKRNYVTYANMKPGIYYFEVDAINTDGFLAKSPATLKISIAPPFWRSYWFVMLQVFLLALISIFIYRYLLNQRTNKLMKAQYEEIKLAHEQVKRSENNLKELNATKDKFFSIISHDLKNPFTSVLSISELLDSNFENAERDELKFGVKKIHKTNRHIYELLENLLTWSRSQRGKIDVQPCSFNLSQLIDTNVNILKLSAEKKSLKIEKKYAENIQAFADREMVSTVVRNLLNNAVKFTDKDKSISIIAETENSHVTVRIKDEGMGISESNLTKLFRIDDKFKSDGTDGEKGTGLGLIICKEFIEKNKGELIVNSELDKGSTFAFTLPVN